MNSINRQGYNTLHTAAAHQYSYVLDILAAHKSKKVRNLVWDKEYLERKTEDENKLTALQIACRNKDKESVEVLLKYLSNPPPEQQTVGRRGPYPIHRSVVPAKYILEFQRAISFIKAQGIHTEKHEDILMRSFQYIERIRSYDCCRRGCTCKFNYEHGDRIQKCFNCIDNPCSTKTRDTLVCSLLSMNADMSDYVLHRRLHIQLYSMYTRCSINLLLRSFGMKDLSHSIFNWLVQLYWRNGEYEALGILYASVNRFVMYQSWLNIDSEHIDQIDRTLADVESPLRNCILQTTHIDKDISGLKAILCLKYAAEYPRTLQNCCIISIRRSLSSNVIKKAEVLPIPQILKNEVMLTRYQKKCSTSGVCYGVRIR